MREVPFTRSVLGTALAENQRIEEIYSILVEVLETEVFDDKSLKNLSIPLLEKLILMAINLFRSSLLGSKVTISKTEIFQKPVEILQSVHSFYLKHKFRVPPIEVFWFSLYENDVRYRMYFLFVE